MDPLTLLALAGARALVSGVTEHLEKSAPVCGSCGLAAERGSGFCTHCGSSDVISRAEWSNRHPTEQQLHDREVATADRLFREHSKWSQERERIAGYIGTPWCRHCNEFKGSGSGNFCGRCGLRLQTYSRADADAAIATLGPSPYERTS